jgi:hypothetical protein
MRGACKACVLAIVTVLAPVSDGAAKAPSSSKGSMHERVMLPHSYIRSLRRGEWRGLSARRTLGRGNHFVALVGDPDSGLGFYPLPNRYRLGASRYRLAHQRPYWQNPVLFAIAADAARYNDWIPANQGYRYGVFDPVEGVGTPFFGGYYGPAGDDNEPPPLPPAAGTP